MSSLQKIPFFNLASSLTPVGSSLPVDRSTVTNSCTLTDAQRYRLGVNYQTIPVRNVVLRSKFSEAHSRSNIQVNCPLSPVGMLISVRLQMLFLAYRWAAFLLGLIRPSANFQRDGSAVHDDNQGNRPNYPSTQETLNLPTPAYNDANHTIWVCSLNLLVIKLMTD